MLLDLRQTSKCGIDWPDAGGGPLCLDAVQHLSRDTGDRNRGGDPAPCGRFGPFIPGSHAYLARSARRSQWLTLRSRHSILCSLALWLLISSHRHELRDRTTRRAKLDRDHARIADYLAAV